MANNLIANLEALLEGFRDDILTEAFILNVHNRVVEVRIECGACGSVDDGDVNALETFGQLRHGQLDTLFIFGVGGLCLERPLEVIVGRQQCGYGAADCIGVRLLALALAALAEVVVLRRHAEIMAAVLSCALSYEYIAKWIVANYPNADQHEFYGEWVQGYASEDYAAENRKLVAYMERLSEGYTESQLARLTDIFVACSRYESMFWDMAWNEAM